MTEMDKALSILNDESITITEIANTTGITRQSISGWRKEDNDFSKARWVHVHSLATMYDDLKFNEAAGLGMNNFIARMALWFKEAYDNEQDLSHPDEYGNDESYGDERQIMNVIKAMQDSLSNSKEEAVKYFDAYNGK